MKKELELKEGKEYITRGGWTAKVLYIDKINESTGITVYSQTFIAPHTYKEKEEIVHHDNNGMALISFGVHVPPTFKGQPADIIKEKKK